MSFAICRANGTPSRKSKSKTLSQTKKITNHCQMFEVEVRAPMFFAKYILKCSLFRMLAYITSHLMLYL